MTEWVAIVISGIALLVSAVTAWLTFLRKGEVKMTQPTVVFFGPDGDPDEADKTRIKVFLRTLLYSTSRRGQIVESMHVNLQRAESKQNFSIWVYGDERLARGSGLHVGFDGIACNHHFLLPADGAEFKLLSGQYIVRVFAKRVSDHQPRQIAEVALSISEAQARELDDHHAGMYFDWGPDQQAYHAHIDVRKSKPMPPWLLKAATD